MIGVELVGSGGAGRGAVTSKIAIATSADEPAVPLATTQCQPGPKLGS
jgi:hypothetical protein